MKSKIKRYFSRHDENFTIGDVSKTDNGDYVASTSDGHQMRIKKNSLLWNKIKRYFG